MRQFPISKSALNWLEDILSERFGQKWSLTRDKEVVEMRLIGEKDRILFTEFASSLTESHSNQEYTTWNCKEEGWHAVLDELLPAPGFSKLTNPLIEKKGNDYHVKYDILGLIYWMLARVEEIERVDLDMHQRFPASSSHAYKHGYLERPVVDEWLNILFQVIQKQWPKIQFKKHNFETLVTCDVDHPFKYTSNFLRIFKIFVGDIIKRKSLKIAFEGFVNGIYVFFGFLDKDPYYQSLLYIMDECEKNNLSLQFNFITYKSHQKFDVDAGLSLNVKQIAKNISRRGHMIGCHPGYECYDDRKNLEQSFLTYKHLLSEVDIKDGKLIGRQHFLRWKTPETARILDELKLDYDSTLGYADKIGFRCGTCHEFTMFDPISQNQLNLRQRPLVLMDVTIATDQYMKLSKTEALQSIEKMKSVCQKVNGKFVVLWHNSSFTKKSDYEFFNRIIS